MWIPHKPYITLQVEGDAYDQIYIHITSLEPSIAVSHPQCLSYVHLFAGLAIGHYVHFSMKYVSQIMYPDV